MIDDDDPCNNCYQSLPVTHTTSNCNQEDSDDHSNNKTSLECSDQSHGSGNDSMNIDFAENEIGDGNYLFDHDISVSVKSNGELVMKAAQVADYQLCSKPWTTYVCGIVWHRLRNF